MSVIRSGTMQSVERVGRAQSCGADYSDIVPSVKSPLNTMFEHTNTLYYAQHRFIVSRSASRDWPWI
jgi:hypothetical protein